MELDSVGFLILLLLSESLPSVGVISEDLVVWGTMAEMARLVLLVLPLSPRTPPS